MAALGRQMTRSVAREAVASDNLANLDTPGYHTKEVTFDQALTDQLNAATLSVGGGSTTGAATDTAPEREESRTSTVLPTGATATTSSSIASC